MAIHVLPEKPVIRRSLAESLLGCIDHEMEHSERLAFGSAFHRFVATYTLHCQAIKEETAQTEVTEHAWDAWAKTRGLDQARYDEFMELCLSFGTTRLAKLHTLWAIETTITHDIGWAILRCTLDRIDRMDSGDVDDPPIAIRIIDYKTEWGEMSHDFQIKFYAQMAFLRWPSLKTIDFEIDWSRWGDDPVFIKTYERYELDNWWAATLDGLRAAWFAPKGDPTGGRWCHDCKLRGTCAEAIAEARSAPQTEGQADDLLARRHRHRALADLHDGQLAEFYRDRPPRVVQDEEVGWLRPKEETVRIVNSARVVWGWFKKALKGGQFDLKEDDLELSVRIKNQRKNISAALVEAKHAVRELGPPAYKTRAYIENPAKGRQAKERN